MIFDIAVVYSSSHLGYLLMACPAPFSHASLTLKIRHSVNVNFLNLVMFLRSATHTSMIFDIAVVYSSTHHGYFLMACPAPLSHALLTLKIRHSANVNFLD